MESRCRYVAIRIRKKQRADGSTVKYFAVVSNVWEWTTKRLLERHREKAGSIEAVHDLIKNELAGGVMPCGRFGANHTKAEASTRIHAIVRLWATTGLPNRPWL
jgi:hypothetical protein